MLDKTLIQRLNLQPTICSYPYVRADASKAATAGYVKTNLSIYHYLPVNINRLN